MQDRRRVEEEVDDEEADKRRKHPRAWNFFYHDKKV